MLHFEIKSQFIHMDRCSFIIVWLENNGKANTVLNAAQLQELTIGWSSDHKTLVKKLILDNYQYNKVSTDLMNKLRSEFSGRLKVITYYCGTEYVECLMGAIEEFVRKSIKLAFEIVTDNKATEIKYPNLN